MVLRFAWTLVWLLSALRCCEGNPFMQCYSKEPIPNVPGTNNRDPSIPAEWTSLVDLCGDYTRGLGIFCGIDEPPLLVFTPLSPMFDHADHAYLRDKCAEQCWCLARRADDDVAQTSGAQGRVRGYYPLDLDGNPDMPDDESSIDPDDENMGPSDDGSLPSWLDEYDNSREEEARNPPPMPLTYQEGHNVDPNWDQGVTCDADLFGHPSADDCRTAIAAITDEFLLQSLHTDVQFLHQGLEIPDDLMDEPMVRPPWGKSVGTGNTGCTVAIHMLPWVATSDAENPDYVDARANAINKKCVSGGVGGWAKAGSIKKSIGIFLYGPNSKIAKELDALDACSASGVAASQCNSILVTGPGSPIPVNPPATNPGTQPQPIPVQCAKDCQRQADCGAISSGCLCSWDATNPRNAAHVVNGFPASTSWDSLTCLSMVAKSISGKRDITTPNNTDHLPKYTIDDSNPPLTCPCNCTYTSYGCCESENGIVHEDASKRINTVITGPEGTCCDDATGLWAEAPDGSDTEKDPACPASAAVPVRSPPSSAGAAKERRMLRNDGRNSRNIADA